MIRYFFPVLMIGISAGIYFLFIDPLYKDVEAHRAQVTQLNEALENADQIIKKRDELQSVVLGISEENMERLQKMLPANVDNVRLILEIDQLATTHKMILKNVDVEKGSGLENSGSVGPDLTARGTIVLKMTLEGAYDAFRTFVENLDKALRIVDVSAITIGAPNGEGVSQYILEIRAYWLK